MRVTAVWSDVGIGAVVELIGESTPCGGNRNVPPITCVSAVEPMPVASASPFGEFIKPDMNDDEPSRCQGRAPLSSVTIERVNCVVQVRLNVAPLPVPEVEPCATGSLGLAV